MDFVDKIVDYLRSSKAELEKVTWPSRQDTLRYSTLVIAGSVALAALFAVLDRGLVKGVEMVLVRRVAAPTETTLPTQPIDVQTQDVQVDAQPTTPAVDLENIPAPKQF
ncbi:MAG: preprotein translocase subunit SecE [Patescibacteria group bacterium]